MRLFTALFLDEDVDILVARLLRARAFGVLTTVEAGRRGRDDEAQLAFAAASGYAIVTHNRADYENIARMYLAENRRHAGIIVAVRNPPHEIVRRLLRILDQLTADEMHDQLLYL